MRLTRLLTGEKPADISGAHLFVMKLGYIASRCKNIEEEQKIFRKGHFYIDPVLMIKLTLRHSALATLS